MSLYVVLNFEDRYGFETKGSADSTIKALQYRYEKKKQPILPKRLFLGAHRVIEHRCVEEDHGIIRFSADGGRLAEIRSDCKQAEKIYVVVHGDPRTPDDCYTNDPNAVAVIRLSDHAQLSTFLRSVLPAKCRVALIMCYGARAAQYLRGQVDHSGPISPDDLKTSFAYQLFRGIVQTSAVRMTAVTGKIQHDATTGHALVEHEDMIDENMAFSDAAKAQTVSKGALNTTYATLRAQPGGEASISQAIKKLRADPGAPITNAFEQYASDLIAWENSGGAALLQNVKDAQNAKRAQMAVLQSRREEEMMPKYGKFIYTYQNNVLTVARKYGKPGDPNSRPMTILYKGPLL